jgi:membrane protease YdiL (CAAX protease family)
MSEQAQPESPTSSHGFADRLRGFGPLGLLAIALVFLGGNGALPLGGLLVLLWARWSETPWRDLGFVRPKNWIVTAVAAVLFGVAFKVLLKSVVMPLLGADPINRPYHYLVGNEAALPGAIWTMFAGAGFGEETTFRGFAFERLRRLLGWRPWARVTIVIITALGFGAAHYSTQGVAGVQQATVFGLVFGAIYARARSLAFLMVAHTAFDLTALAIIYWDAEERFAHLFFR